MVFYFRLKRPSFTRSLTWRDIYIFLFISILYLFTYWLWQPYSNTDPYCSRKTPSFRELEPQNTGILDSQIMKETSHPTCTLTSRSVRFVWVSSQTAWSSPSQWSVSNRETSKVYLPWPRKVWKFTLFDAASGSTICSICIFLFRPFDTLMFVLYPLSFFECFSRCLFLRQSEILLVLDRVRLSQFLLWSEDLLTLINCNELVRNSSLGLPPLAPSRQECTGNTYHIYIIYNILYIVNIDGIIDSIMILHITNIKSTQPLPECWPDLGSADWPHQKCGVSKFC